MVRTASPTASSPCGASTNFWWPLGNDFTLHNCHKKKCHAKVVGATPSEGFLVANCLGISLYVDTPYMLYSVKVYVSYSPVSSTSRLRIIHAIRSVPTSHRHTYTCRHRFNRHITCKHGFATVHCPIRHVTNAYEVRETTSCPPVSFFSKTRQLLFFGVMWHVWMAGRQNHRWAINAQLGPLEETSTGAHVPPGWGDWCWYTQSANINIHLVWTKANHHVLWQWTSIIKMATFH